MTIDPLPPGWVGDATRIRRTFRFATFPRALAFMVEVGYRCEAMNHHPDWKNVHDRIEVELTTHDVGRVTARDLDLAAHMNAVHARYAADG